MDYQVQAIKKKIIDSKISIYDPSPKSDPALWYTNEQLEFILNKHLKNISLNKLPLRTRSKVVKGKVCEALGYPVPKSFKKTKHQARFPGQNFDTYTQKRNNLQIWNEDIIANRRYVIINLNNDDVIESVKVVTGDVIAAFDKTGTLTQKYQATVKPSNEKYELITPNDTSNLIPIIDDSAKNIKNFQNDPTDIPESKLLLPIKEIFERLKPLVSQTFTDIGKDQERNRGTYLHKLVCTALGYSKYSDKGQFPDIVHQLLEVKLQSSPTIDLGLVAPSSRGEISIPKINNITIRHSDIRYVIFYCKINDIVKLTNLILVTGEKFFSRVHIFYRRF